MPTDPEKALIAMREGISNFFKGDYATAQKYFETTLFFQPKNDEAFHYIVRCIQGNEELKQEEKNNLIHARYQTRLRHDKTPELYAEYLHFISISPFHFERDILAQKIEEGLATYPLAAELYAEASKIYNALNFDYHPVYKGVADDFMIKTIRMRYSDIDFLINNFGSRLLKPVAGMNITPLEVALYENNNRNYKNLGFCEKALELCMKYEIEDNHLIDIIKGKLEKLDPQNYLLKMLQEDFEVAADADESKDAEKPSAPTVPLALAKVTPLQLPKKVTAEEIKKSLDEYVIGQEDAKIIVSIEGENHYERVFENHDIPKSNILLIGKSGLGKALICETLAGIIGVPFVILDCTNLSDTGYVGKNFSDVFGTLYSKAGQNKELAEKGMIFLDELDKLADRNSSWKDVSGMGVQEEMLKPLEKGEVTIELPSNMGNASGGSITLSTKNILFIGAGAFARYGTNPSLEELINNTKSTAAIGFQTGKNEVVKTGQEILAEHLIQYGLHEQLAKRFTDYALLKDFSEEELVRILVEPKDAIIKRLVNYFQSKGVQLEFTPGGLKEIAAHAKKLGSGARALHRTCNIVLRELKFNIKNIEKHQIIDATFVRSRFK